MHKPCDSLLKLVPLPPSFSVNLYKVTGQFPWSSLRETDRGVSAEYSVSTPGDTDSEFIIDKGGK